MKENKIEMLRALMIMPGMSNIEWKEFTTKIYYRFNKDLIRTLRNEGLITTTKVVKDGHIQNENWLTLKGQQLLKIVREMKN